MTKEQDVPSNRHSDLFLVLFSFAILILSIPRLDFSTRVQLPVPPQQLHTYSSRPHSHTVSHTCTKKKKKAKGHHGRVTTPWYEGNPGEPPQCLLPSGVQPAQESEQNQKSAIVHLQDQGHEQILYLTHFPPFHECLSVPLTLYSSV